MISSVSSTGSPGLVGLGGLIDTLVLPVICMSLISPMLFRYTDMNSGSAVFYSFSFAPNHKWSSLYPPGPEIVEYLLGVCGQYEIIDKIQLNSDVSSCRWDEAEGVWEMTIHELVLGAGDLSSYDRLQKVKQHGEESIYVRSENIKAKVLISAVGGLVEPNRWPENIPGKDIFQGEIFHSARWRYEIDLKDKDIVVLGTGCSAAQFVPELTKVYGAKSVTQLMRSPPWVTPKQTPPLEDDKWVVWGPWLNTHIPGFAKSMRAFTAARSEFDWRLFGTSQYSEEERAKLEIELLDHMRKAVPKKYHEVRVAGLREFSSTTDNERFSLQTTVLVASAAFLTRPGLSPSMMIRLSSPLFHLVVCTRKA